MRAGSIVAGDGWEAGFKGVNLGVAATVRSRERCKFRCRRRLARSSEKGVNVGKRPHRAGGEQKSKKHVAVVIIVVVLCRSKCVYGQTRILEVPL